MNIFVLLVFIALAVIFGVLSFLLKYKHSEFPDCSVGYRDRRLMSSKEKWDNANKLCGSLCFVCAVVSIIVPILLYLTKTGVALSITVLFIWSATAIALVLVIPIICSKKYDRS